MRKRRRSQRAIQAPRELYDGNMSALTLEQVLASIPVMDQWYQNAVTHARMKHMLECCREYGESIGKLQRRRERETPSSDDESELLLRR